ncbi:hypothetical protein AMTRI_Chr12g236370 [Amborella trichopoda]
MRRRRRLPPPPHPAPARPSPQAPFLSRHPLPHSAPARPSPPTPFLSRHPPSRVPATPFNWNRIYDLYPKSHCHSYKASPKDVQTLTSNNPQRVSPTTEPGPHASFWQVVTRFSPSLPPAGPSVCPEETPSPPKSHPSLCPFFVSIPLEVSSLLKAKFQ